MLRLTFVVVCLLWAGAAEAKNLCVNGSTGNDATSYASNNGTSTCWQTIGRAAWGSTSRSSPNSGEAAAAGDVVLVAGGTYTYSGSIGSSWAIVYNPANEGSSGNPITFTCIGTCVLEAQNANAAIIGSDGRDYVTWYADRSLGYAWSITACGLAAAPTGCTAPIFVNPYDGNGAIVCHDVTACLIEGVVINGSQQTDYADNWEGVRVEACASCSVRNSTIYSFHNGSDNSNGAGLKIYCSSGTFEHNVLSDAGSGVFFKDGACGTQPGPIVFRLNTIDDVSYGVGSSVTPDTGSRNVYQNLLTNVGSCFHLTGNGANDGDVWANNTCVTADVGFSVSTALGGLMRFYGNICVDCAVQWELDDATMPADTVIDGEHNCYDGFTTFYHGSDGNRTFTNFKSAYSSQEQAATATVNSDPLFVGGSPYSYQLQGGSPCKAIQTDVLDLDNDGSSVDTIDAGAYVTGTERIGLDVAASSSLVRLRIRGEDQ